MVVQGLVRSLHHINNQRGLRTLTINSVVPSLLLLVVILVLGWGPSVVTSRPLSLFRDTSSYKGFSGVRLRDGSKRMVYFQEQTIAVVELGPEMTLENCELVEVYKPQEAKEALRNLTKISKPLKIPFDLMMELMDKCQQLENPEESHNTSSDHSTVRGSSSDSPFSLLNGILPGTKWCGTGDIAETYYDLGNEAVIDKCCRTHDLCPIKVRAFEYRYNLTNYSVYSKSHCACDDKLYRCLKETKHPTANIMGNVYFNLVQVPCLEEEHSRVCVAGPHYACTKWADDTTRPPQLKFQNRRRSF